MRWLELSLCVAGEAAEAVAGLLGRYGHQGVVIEQNGIPPDAWDEGAAEAPDSLTLRAWFPHNDDSPTRCRDVETALGHMSMILPLPRPTWRLVKDEDWAHAWKAHYRPLRVGRRLLVRPVWSQSEVRDDELEIVLDPGMAFGTGTHPSTRLCLQALEDHLQVGSEVLDLGCGSGILAIAAARLGAGSVLALDNDAVAVSAARQNLEFNPGVSGVSVEEGSLGELLARDQRFDLVVVNILARVITAFCAEGLGELLRPGGCGIFSGIIQDQADDVSAALCRAGMTPVATLRQADWVALVTCRPPAA
ncbi:MAG: 50S ribosomal protein L11 methyltransferase [Anaerolineaceae bacterium]|nr:50S ribosomal protein L11 methyltransferase [Anaerolineaceae bacterium]